MCGIVGVVASRSSPSPDREGVERAVLALRHRGPDGTAVHAQGAALLGHTRLSIIDLQYGSQPMSNEDGSIWTVYNGEIWNFYEVRRELEAGGHRFATRCDTEVLVHGYEHWGEDLVRHLRGMFAFAIWDAPRERLMLARDRLGKKPLYVSHVENGVSFGSDARSVLLAARRQPRLDETALAQFLFQRYVCAPATLFRGVERLPPGHILSYDRDHAEIRPYWSLPRESRLDHLDARELRRLLRNSVRDRLMSDVPLGVFLSGGVDSAAVLGLMREAGVDDVASFTVGFDDPIFDERPRARVTANAFRSDHYELAVGAADFSEALPRLAWYRDEPIAEPAEIPLLLLAEFAGRHLKVVLSGEGGDELFGGYPKYRAERLLALPLPGLAAVLRLLASLRALRPSHRQLQRAVETIAIRDPLLRWSSWFRAFSADDLRNILSPRLVETASPDRLTAPLAALLEPYREVEDARRILIGDLLTYLPDNMLLRADKVLMAGSVEGRMPLLDHCLVERVVRAPASQRAGLLTSKKVLRDAVAELVPQEVLHGPKLGFPVPVARFLLEDRARLADRLVLSERALDRGLFDREALRALVHAARSSRRASQLQLFTLMSLELWLRTCVDRVTLTPPASLDALLDGDEADALERMRAGRA